jgi:CheY-like chemotaxis protein/DNA-directed RNA polymerase specialized sigma24 family protein
MSLAQKIAPHLPLLRRYGRALSGSQQSGDAYVKVTLQALLEDNNSLDPKLTPRVALYRAFHTIWSSASVEQRNGEEVGFAAKAQERLQALSPPARQALLLTTIEGFSEREAAAIMNVSTERVAEFAAQARDMILAQSRARVLIVEDEMLIGLDLSNIVEGLGHDVVEIVSTAQEAVRAAKEHEPNLVLADIQLADGSSGIEAVKTILAESTIPVVFITAFPDRLLTGERPEPTFLITKPYSENTVQAAVSQALFFESSSTH